jgi:peroxiredoxin
MQSPYIFGGDTQPNRAGTRVLQRAIKSMRIIAAVCSSIAFTLAAGALMLGGGKSGVVIASGEAGWAGTPSASSGGLIPEKSRQIAPPLAIKDIDGNPITLAKYRGKVVLLDFWAVDCGGCKLEIPWYVQFDQKYHREGLRLIGIDMYGESTSVIKAFMEKSHMTYTVAVGTDSIGQRFHVGEMPLTLLIDRQDHIAYSHAGVVDKDSFERNIEALLSSSR